MSIILISEMFLRVFISDKTHLFYGGYEEKKQGKTGIR